MQKIFTSVALLFFLQVSVRAQLVPGEGERMQPAGRIFGKITDAGTKKGIEAASVQIFWTDAFPGKKGRDSLIGGMLSLVNGDFNVGGIPVNATYRVLVTAIGYLKMEKTIRIESGNLEKDLGNLALEIDPKFLTSVTVVGQKPGLQMSIDRKVFNVEKNITTAGGTGIDVMKNIPGVTVDVDGNVLLRNASPQIFVDGLPTILTLDQIPADNIERIELITNPSAKFDASSSAGIINVVLKKNRKFGLNGIVSAGAGYPGILNGSLTLNQREGKLNFFVSGNYNRSGGIAKGNTLRQNKIGDSIMNYFNQYSENDRIRRFQSIRFGMDYFLDNRNTLTISQNFVSGRFTNEETQFQEYFNSSKIQERTGDRFSDGRFGFNRSSTQAVFRHRFAQTGRELSLDLNYNTGSGNDYSSIINTFYNTDGSLYADPTRVLNNGDNSNNQFTGQLNYEKPVGENGKWEAGLRTYLNRYQSRFIASSIDESGNATKLPLSNNYQYSEMVNAAFVTYSNAWKSLKYQVGLRAEQSQFDGELIDSALKFGYDYPSSLDRIFDALFPSVFLTKTIAEGTDIQINYTRRIRRPNFWQLNPFVDINDPVNLRQGNPQLQPEFTNSFEFNYNKTYETGNFLGVIYYRNNQGDITRYSDTISKEQYNQLNNAGVDPNAILNTFINARSTNRLGAQLAWQQRWGKNFDINPSVDLQYQKVNADLGNQNLSNEGFNWEAKMIVNYKLVVPGSFFHQTSFQLTGEYESREVRIQGYNKPQYSVDIAIRKDLFKGNKGNITLGINDVFNSRRWQNVFDTELFYQESSRRWNVRNFRLTFTWKFGKNNFSFFKRNGKQGDNEAPGEEARF